MAGLQLLPCCDYLMQSWLKVILGQKQCCTSDIVTHATQPACYFAYTHTYSTMSYTNLCLIMQSWSALNNNVVKHTTYMLTSGSCSQMMLTRLCTCSLPSICYNKRKYSEKCNSSDMQRWVLVTSSFSVSILRCNSPYFIEISTVYGMKTLQQLSSEQNSNHRLICQGKHAVMPILQDKFTYASMTDSASL